jgi:rubrerythrin
MVMCEKRIQNGWQTCAPCDTPCRRLKDLDKRYTSKYYMSMIENLAVIRNQGMRFFLRQQAEKYRCSVCGGTVCVHRDNCPSCKAPVW